MIKVESVNEASKLVFGYMKPGILTNHVMSADEYRAEIETKTLFAHTWPGGLVFFRKREGYWLLGYFITDAGIPLDIELPGNAVVEIGYKSSGVESASRAVQFWKGIGLKPVLERIRLTRPPGLTSIEAEKVFVVAEQDIDDCNNLINASFDPVIGHIPDYYELSRSIKAGNVLCIKDSTGAVCGLLRIVSRGASVEIRQLALREDMRGRRLARNLLDAFIEKWGDRKSTVWMKDGYAPAFRTYTTAGFAVDGWRSYVLAN